MSQAVIEEKTDFSVYKSNDGLKFATALHLFRETDRAVSSLPFRPNDKLTCCLPNK